MTTFPSASTNLFRREGEYWTLTYSGQTIRLRDTVGVHYLAHLLSHPHQRIRAQELVALVTGDEQTDAERARSAVTKRIRSAIGRVSQHHPGLGYHLITTIRTGYECVYLANPEDPLGWSV